MNRIVIFIAILGLGLIGCTPEKQSKRTYDDDKLIGVMIDLYAAEAAIKDLKESHKDSLIIVYRDQIGIIQEVEMSTIDRDLELLQSNLEDYSRLHKIVRDSIVAIEKKRSKILKSNKTAKQKEQIKKTLPKPSKGN